MRALAKVVRLERQKMLSPRPAFSVGMHYCSHDLLVSSYRMASNENGSMKGGRLFLSVWSHDTYHAMMPTACRTTCHSHKQKMLVGRRHWATATTELPASAPMPPFGWLAHERLFRVGTKPGAWAPYSSTALHRDHFIYGSAIEEGKLLVRGIGI